MRVLQLVTVSYSQEVVLGSAIFETDAFVVVTIVFGAGTAPELLALPQGQIILIKGPPAVTSSVNVPSAPTINGF
jgi:hypothetical protein